jgi:hypothetical protein
MYTRISLLIAFTERAMTAPLTAFDGLPFVDLRSTEWSYTPKGPRRPRLPVAGGGSCCRDGVGGSAGRAIGLRGCRGGRAFALDMDEL